MILFCDRNVNLVEKVSALKLPNLVAITDDIFKYSGVIVSASNPDWTFGGGLDAYIKSFYPYECNKKQEIGGGNTRIGNVVFTITVERNLKATRQLVTQAIKYALKVTKPQETLLLTGLGCGVGNLESDVFIKILRDCIYAKKTF